MPRYIDADALYRRVKEKTNPYGKPTLDYESGVKVLNMIEQTPTADVVEVKHGHWLNIGFGEYWCSVCDTNGEDILDKRGDPNWKHCPNCDAKMDGGAE